MCIPPLNFNIFPSPLHVPKGNLCEACSTDINIKQVERKAIFIIDIFFDNLATYVYFKTRNVCLSQPVFSASSILTKLSLIKTFTEEQMISHLIFIHFPTHHVCNIFFFKNFELKRQNCFLGTW